MTLGSGPRSASAMTPAMPHTGAPCPHPRGTTPRVMTPRRTNVLRARLMSTSTQRERCGAEARKPFGTGRPTGSRFGETGAARPSDAGARRLSSAGQDDGDRRSSGASCGRFGEITTAVVGEHHDGDDDRGTVPATRNGALDDGGQAEHHEDVFVELGVIEAVCPRLIGGGADKRREYGKRDQDGDDY